MLPLQRRARSRDSAEPARGHSTAATSSVHTVKLLSAFGPKLLLIATSAAIATAGDQHPADARDVVARVASRTDSPAEGDGFELLVPPRDSSGRSERWVTRSGRRKDISASGPRLFNAAGSAELSSRCGLGRPRAWAALAARLRRLRRTGRQRLRRCRPDASPRPRRRQAEPVGKHFFRCARRAMAPI